MAVVEGVPVVADVEAAVVLPVVEAAAVDADV